MTPDGGEVGRGSLTAAQRRLVDELGSYEQLAEEVGRSADDVRTWWSRNNYRIRDLAVRSDLRPPLFRVAEAGAVLRSRISGRSDL